jgi:predicted flap endonuclease-1-like 5' DNA nuclease
MTYLTGFFLVFAGMLFGYFLWYRDRRGDDQAFAENERENSDLRLGLNLAQQAKEELEARMVRQQGQLSVLQQLFDDWTTTREQTERERAILVAELQDKRTSLDEASQEIQRLRQLQRELADRPQPSSLPLENSLKESHDQLKRARGEAAAAIAEKKAAQQSLAEMQVKFSQLKQETDALRLRIGHAEALEQELSNLKQTIEKHQQQLETVERQRELAIASEKSIQTTAAGLQTRLHNQESTIHRLRQQHREAMDKIQYELQLRAELEAAYEKKCQAMEQRFQEQHQRIVPSSSDRAAGTDQPSRHAARTRIDDLEAEIGQRDQKILRLTGELASSIEQGKSLHQQNESLQQKYEEMLKELALIRTVRTDQATILSFSKAIEAHQRTTFDEEYGGTLHNDPLRGPIYTQEPNCRDDLKRISGVAEVLEAKLNDQGVYTFKQIAQWTPQAIEEFGRILRFKDRIVRDDWPGQAKALYEKTIEKKSRAPRAA